MPRSSAESVMSRSPTFPSDAVPRHAPELAARRRRVTACDRVCRSASPRRDNALLRQGTRGSCDHPDVADVASAQAWTTMRAGLRHPRSRCRAHRPADAAGAPRRGSRHRPRAARETAPGRSRGPLALSRTRHALALVAEEALSALPPPRIAWVTSSGSSAPTPAVCRGGSVIDPRSSTNSAPGPGTAARSRA